MQDGTRVHRAARFVLRALLLAVAAFVVVLIGASTAQADDSDAAVDAQPEQQISEPAPEPAPEADEATEAAETAQRSTARLVRTVTDTVREVGREAPAAKRVTRPVTEAVAEVVDRTAGEVTGHVVEVTRSAEALVDGPVTDVVDDVVAPAVPPHGPAPDAGVASTGTPQPSPAAASSRQDRRADSTGPASSAGTIAETFIAHATPGSPSVSVDLPHHVPSLEEILALGAFSGAPSAGSGAAGGPAAASTLPAAFVAPAVVCLGMVSGADEERLFALPLRPGWSPD